MVLQQIYFVRHGEKSPSNTYNSKKNSTLELTKRGEQQARAVGRFLKPLAIQIGFSSPYTRARRTAELANEALTIPIGIEPSFSERVLLAKDAISEAESKLAFDKSQADWTYHTGSGESLVAVVNRFTKAINKILLDKSLERIVVFTHGRALQSYLHSAFPVDGFGEAQLSIPSASIYRVDYNDGIPVSVNVLFIPLKENTSQDTSVPTLADTIVKKIKNTTIHKSHLTSDRMASNVQKNIYEIESLNYLESIGIAVPGNRTLIDSGAFIEMDYISGKTLGEALATQEDHTNQLHETGKLLRSIHDAIDTHDPPSTFTVNLADGTINAQCALNMKHLTLGWLGDYSIKQQDATLTAILDQVRAILKKHPEYLVSNKVIYGDFKPDNLIIGDRVLYSIDPHFSYGRRSCDPAKMIARLYLTNPKKAETQASSFIEGYGKTEYMTEIYHMAAFDILNTYSRLLAKDLLKNQLTIASHRKTVDNITTCIETVVPRLLKGSL